MDEGGRVHLPDVAAAKKKLLISNPSFYFKVLKLNKKGQNGLSFEEKNGALRHFNSVYLSRGRSMHSKEAY